jgi:hypothetical protein
MNREVPASDMLLGSVLLAAFLACVLGAGWLLSRWKNSRYEKAWRPLIPVIDGVVSGDGGGAATSWLTGTYKGRRVRASMVPGRNRHREESGIRYNYFDVALLDVGAGRDWRMEEGEGQAEGLRAKLGNPRVEYIARTRSLVLSEDAGAGWIPSPERFREELELLLSLAEASEESTER